jgi:hypothetical protein
MGLEFDPKTKGMTQPMSAMGQKQPSAGFRLHEPDNLRISRPRPRQPESGSAMSLLFG